MFLPAAMKLGQGNIFTSVCLFTGGFCLSACWDAHPLDQTALGPDPTGTRPTPPPSGTRPPPPEADSSIRSTSSQYTSHWNAFLLHMSVILSTGGLPQCMLGYPPGTSKEQTTPLGPGHIQTRPHPGADPPTGADIPPCSACWYGGQVGDMHPTGMQSCFLLLLCRSSLSLSLSRTVCMIHYSL